MTLYIVLWIFIILTTLWALAALYYFSPFPSILRVTLLAGWGIGVYFGFARLGPEYGYIPFLIGFILILILWQFKRPSHDRDWVPLQQHLPVAEINGTEITIHNVRNARYASETEAESVQWEKRSYNLDSLETIDFFVIPFGEWEGPAHTFLTFGFKDGQHFAVSVEARREKGEQYGVIRGLFREFETMYVIGDELDVIGARTGFSGDNVYLFPITAAPERMKKMLVSMLNEASRISEKPAFYNTVTNSCTSAIARHLNAIRDRKIGFDLRVILPGYSDRLAYEMGLIDIPKPYKENREQYRINSKADLSLPSREFSRKIRENHRQIKK